MMSRVRYFGSVNVRPYVYQAMTGGVSSHGVQLVWSGDVAAGDQKGFFQVLFVPTLEPVGAPFGMRVLCSKFSPIRPQNSPFGRVASLRYGGDNA